MTYPGDSGASVKTPRVICPRCRVGQITGGAVACPLCGQAVNEYGQRQAAPPAIEISARRELERQFRVERTLGKGGMSIVYLAHEIDLGRQVAVKVLPLQLTLDADAAERFKREAKISASLDHPHIVPIYQVGSTSTFVWYSMKWVDGRSLRELLSTQGSLSIEDALRILEPVASALHHAHRRGIVHRDVKPENVLIDKTGWVMVCDFGIAKAFGTVPLTPTGGTIGTPGYMSPEQCYGRSLDGRSDQYALAILVYECLTGTVPFTASSLGEIVHKHCLETPPRVTAARPEIEEPVAEALLRALSKQPEDRFETVLDFVKALGGNPARSIPAFALPASVDTVEVLTPREQLLAKLRRIPENWLVSAGVLFALGLTVWLALVPVESPEAPVLGPAAATAPVAAGNGFLAVSAQPWGNLYVDDRPIGPTPVTNLELAPGKYRIRIIREGYGPYEQEVEIAAGQEVKLSPIVLQPAATR